MDQPPLSQHSTLGALFVGVAVAAVLYGVSCAQAFYYFQHNSKNDGLRTKIIAIASLICDTVHQALASHTVYIYLIKYYSRPQELGTPVWSLVISVIFNAIVALLVQIFYAARIWKLSQRNVIIIAILSVFIVGQFVSSIVWVAKSYNKTTLAELTEPEPLLIAMYALAAASDVLITIVFCAFLRGARTNLQGSNTMINQFIAFSVRTGILFSLCAVAALIFITALPHTLIFGTFSFLLCRMYCNSLFGTLNIRNATHEKGHNDIDISLRRIEVPDPLAEGKDKEADVGAEITDVGIHGYITGVKSHDGDDTSSFVPFTTHANSSHAIQTESELDSGPASS